MTTTVMKYILEIEPGVHITCVTYSAYAALEQRCKELEKQNARLRAELAVNKTCLAGAVMAIHDLEGTQP